MLDAQLDTLAAQLKVTEQLSQKGILPVAVLGYCFGEFAASIVSGILALETVVKIIVRRAFALRGVQGTMMNVFAESPAVRRVLVCLEDPPDVAIVAGPSHQVLSGTHPQINEARLQFHRCGIKTIDIDSTVPFHSAAVSTPLVDFSPLSYEPQATSVRYISGVIGGPVEGTCLGPTYWIRHMRGSINFLGAIHHLHQSFPEAQFIDIGPGTGLSKIVERYNWQELSVICPNVILTRVSPSFLPQRFISVSSRNPTRQTSSHLSSPALFTKIPQDTKLEDIALLLLSDMFGLDPSPKLLSRSLHSIGIQSLDFIRFSEEFFSQTGIHLPLSSFATDLPLASIILREES